MVDSTFVVYLEANDSILQTEETALQIKNYGPSTMDFPHYDFFENWNLLLLRKPAGFLFGRPEVFCNKKYSIYEV
jgi:hypothetical protein